MKSSNSRRWLGIAASALVLAGGVLFLGSQASQSTGTPVASNGPAHVNGTPNAQIDPRTGEPLAVIMQDWQQTALKAKGSGNQTPPG